MTIIDLVELPHGTRVTINQPGQFGRDNGTVLITPATPTSDREIMIRWDDGQATDARDHWSLIHVTLLPEEYDR